MPKTSRRSAKDALMNRLQGDFNKKKGGGSLFRSDLRGVNFWSCKEGGHLLDIIPYVAGQMDPESPGTEAYVLEIFVHNNVGASEDMVVCMAQTFKKPCPICEERKRLEKSEADEKRIKDLTPSRYPRSIYNIVCYDSKDEENKGVQVWHTSNFLFQQYLPILAKKTVRGGGTQIGEPFVPFMDLEEGKSIAFTREGKKESTKYIGIRFEDRNYSVSEEIEKSAHVLDELIHWPTYEEVYEAYHGVKYEAGTEKIQSGSSGRGGKYQEEKAAEKPAEKAVEKERGSEPVKEESTRSRREETREEPPARGRRGEAKDETSAKEPPKEEAGSNRCPAGGRFGADIDERPDCDRCSVWKECAKENDRLEKEKK